ncbi:hypothetical protein DPEC_G00047940 [Dallia pectoralis]|uniref:Uncharacterized protein n=1 Tax=Dallia pectoralis TaxID=75939 RepID=A0ACC2HAD2_DALPE|nr:hypothetical protein DPEC_G00047940 [Dallia pectoralis]
MSCPWVEPIWAQSSLQGQENTYGSGSDAGGVGGPWIPWPVTAFRQRVLQGSHCTEQVLFFSPCADRNTFILSSLFPGVIRRLCLGILSLIISSLFYTILLTIEAGVSLNHDSPTALSRDPLATTDSQNGRRSPT